MAIDPRTLESIRNPLAGLSNIGAAYAQGVEMKGRREDREANRAALKIKQEAAVRDEKRKVEKRTEEMAAFRLKQKRDLLSYSEEKRVENLSEASSVNDYIESWKAAAQQDKAFATDPEKQAAFKSSQLQFVTDPDVMQLINSVSPEQYPAVQQSAQFAIKTYSDASGDETFGEFEKIPGTDLYGQQSSKSELYKNVRSGIDGKSKQGDSEFERGIQRGLEEKYFTEEQATDLRKKRTAVLSGTEMRKGAEARLDEKQTDRYNKETKALRQEYTSGSAHFKDMGQSIEGAFAAIDSGDTRLSEVLLNQVMSQVQDTNVKAYQMYSQFDQEFGNLGQRIVGQANRFLLGTRTQRETDEIKSVLKSFKENYVDPASGKLRDRYRQFALQQGKEPFTVVPPQAPEDIIESTLVNPKEKVKLIKDFFPNWTPPK